MLRVSAGFRLAVLLAAFVTITGCGSTAPSTSASQLPSTSAAASPSASVVSTPPPGSITSMVVIGHSGATGYNSDPNAADTDARANSWATGTNPTVNSIYSRLLATHPELEGHGVNAAVDGSLVTDLDGQLDQALATEPAPGLVLIQSVDNDMRCDGTDEENYAAFGKTLAAVLHKIADKSPSSKILVVSSPWATVANYTAVVATIPGGKEASTGTGPCDVFDSAGKPQPSHMKYQQQVIDKYQAQQAAACRQIPACHFDNGALGRMTVTAKDLTPDLNHLTVAGLRKQAATEWKVLAQVL